MSTKIKNIIIACSDARESALLWNFFNTAFESVRITVTANSDELESLLHDQIPGIVIIRLGSNDKGNNPFLNIIRRREDLDLVPVFVYTAMPIEDGLSSLLKKCRKVLDSLPG